MPARCMTMRESGWPTGFEHTANYLGLGDRGSAISLSLLGNLEKLHRMPPHCERCGRGRPVSLVGDGSRVGTAVCATCRGVTAPG